MQAYHKDKKLQAIANYICTHMYTCVCVYSTYLAWHE